MVTTVSADLVQEREVQQTTGQPETMHWHYRVPFPGVRYYGYSPAPSSTEREDPWSLQGILSPPGSDDH